MFDPRDAIASLEAMIADNGEDVVITRIVASQPVAIRCRAFVVPLHAVANAGVEQGNRRLVISANALAPGNWPQGVPAGLMGDPRIPQPYDRVTLRPGFPEARVCTIQLPPRPRYVAGELVRVDFEAVG